ncbi:MAG: ferrous iron transport protein B, partial [Clostridia bacterium]|nr:ferrous iron transport protein B [Clostridia bacterium]
TVMFTLSKNPIEEVLITDLPGLYSLTPLSYEEEVAANYIYEHENKIINICDINILKRNLYLTLQLLEAGKEVAIFVNTMKRKADKNLVHQTKEALSKMGVSFFIGNPNNKNDITTFKKLLKSDFKKIKLNYLNKLKSNKYIDIREIEGDKLFFNKYFKNKKVNFNKNNLENLINLRQNFLNEIFSNKNQTFIESKIDKILLNKFLCIPIFFGILLLIFYLTFFSVGAQLSNILRVFIQDILGKNFVNCLKSFVSTPWVIGLVEVGLVGGVGSLISFLPQVVFLFLFLSLIEDSGYLSRVAFMFEDVFSRLGLSGKSVYTLLMGFGCSTTAALTARNMEDKNAKIKTAMLTPYMSCSAKLPIYAVIGGAFFVKSNVLVIFALYLLGVIVALVLSSVLERTALKSKQQSFILEFPEYRLPSIKRIYVILKDNLKSFLTRVGTLLISLNVIVWLLQSFSFSFEYIACQPNKVSILQSLGGIIAPIFKPLGFGSWGPASALLAGLVAKEVIVSSIAMFNGVNAFGEDIKTQTMQSITEAGAVVFFSPSSALSFMVFCLLYSPCLATISVLKKEIGLKWTILSILIQFSIAYLTAFLVFNFSNMLMKYDFINVLFILLSVFAIALSLKYLLNKKKKKCNCCKNCDFCKKI